MIPDYLFVRPLKIIDEFTGIVYFEISGKILEIGELKSYLNKKDNEIFYYPIKIEVLNPSDISIDVVDGFMWKKSFDQMEESLSIGKTTRVKVEKKEGKLFYTIYKSQIPYLYEDFLNMLDNDKVSKSIRMFDEYRKWSFD